MSWKLKSLLIWIFAVLFTGATAYYQRATGPTYPVKGKVEIGKEEIKYKLLRTSDHAGDQPMAFIVKNKDISGTFEYRRYKSFDEWHSVEMERKGDTLFAYVPHQPPAGKVMYNVSLNSNGKITKLNEEPVIMRYKGKVPDYILIPHILLMFLAMLFSTRTGLEVIFKGPMVYAYSIVTFLLLLPGGMILGPFVQKFAFDAYWTGWPFGGDLTDNKTAVAFLFWIIAVVAQVIKRKEKKGRKLALVASIILLLVYMIPHSMLGSEIDHTKTEQQVENTN